MQKKMKQILMFLGVTIFALTAFFAFGLGKSKAAELPAVTLPVVQFSDLATVGLENSPSHPIRVYLSEKSTEDVTVNYSVVGGTGISDHDYQTLSGSIQIEKGETFADINLNLIDNQKVDGTRDILFSLTSSVNANLGENVYFDFVILDDDMAPVTTLTVVPQANDGQNGWYMTKPQFQLTSDPTAKIYYRVNGGVWVLYQTAVTVEDGTNIIDYYAQDTYLNKELMQTRTFMVDTLKPEINNFAVSLDGQNRANLSWQKSIDDVTYQIWCNGVLIATLPSGAESFIHDNLLASQNYEYYIVVTDLAGNQTISEKHVVQYTIKEVIKEVKGTQDKVKPLPKIKSIGIASSTTKDIRGTISSGADTDLTIASNQDQNKVEDENKDTSARDWNKWLLAISILIILLGVGIGSYYGYQWYVSSKNKDDDSIDKKLKSRW